MRKIIDIKEQTDHYIPNIHILCTVPELFNDHDFEKIEQIKDAKKMFNERTNITYFIKAEDLMRLKDITNNVYLRLIIDSPYKSNISDLLSPRNDFLRMEEFTQSTSKETSPKTNSPMSESMSSETMEIIQKTYKTPKTRGSRTSISTLPLINKKIILDSIEYILYYHKKKSRYSIFLCEKKTEGMDIHCKGVTDKNTSGFKLKDYDNIDVNYNESPLVICALDLIKLKFPIYVYIDDPNISYNMEDFAGFFDIIINNAIVKRKLQI